jgi:hypothetical integral membrane protein (TIGR02206 family)
MIGVTAKRDTIVPQANHGPKCFDTIHLRASAVRSHMDNPFARNFSGPPFEWLGPAHLGALAFILVLNFILARTRNASQAARQRIRWSIALILALNEIAWHAWNYAIGAWTIQTMLPLQLCAVTVWLSAALLLSGNYTLYEFVYFLGIGGAIQALITPDLGPYGFPHFRFFQTFISHGLIVTTALYMTAVEGYRPYPRSILRVALWTNVYVLLMLALNRAIGSNYLMLNGKPGTPSLLDLLPPWPVYILYMEAIGVITCLLLYLPFFLRDRAAKLKASAAPH